MRPKRSAGATPNATAVATVTAHGKAQHHRSNPTSSTRGTASRPRRLQHLDANARQRKADQPAESGEEQAFDEQLANEPSAAGAQRRADRELVDTSGRPCQHEVRHVHAGNQEHEADRDEQQLQRPARGRHQVLLQRNRDDGAQARGREAFLHRPAQARELRPGLLEADAISQPADRAQRVVLLDRCPREAVREPRVHRRRRSDLRSPRARCPTTSYGSPLSRSVEPMTDGSSPKRVRHSRVAQHDATRAGLVARGRIPDRAVRRIEASGSSRS